MEPKIKNEKELLKLLVENKDWIAEALDSLTGIGCPREKERIIARLVLLLESL